MQQLARMLSLVRAVGRCSSSGIRDATPSSGAQGFLGVSYPTPAAEAQSSQPFPVKIHVSVTAELLFTCSPSLLWSCVTGFSFQLWLEPCSLAADTQHRPYKKAGGSLVFYKCSYVSETLFCIPPLL